MKITVLGSGGWGTALAILLLDNGSDVTLEKSKIYHRQNLQKW